MIEQTTSQDAHKKGLQRQIRKTRDSVRDTVEQIQDAAEEKYQAVKKTVSDVLDYREEFQRASCLDRWCTLGRICRRLYSRLLPQGRPEQERLTGC